MTFEEYEKMLPLKYYDVDNDIQLFPDAIIYVVISSRGRGKTYSILDKARRENKQIMYLKRTNDDIAFICRECENENDIDTSPYYPINRDKGTNIRGFNIDKGIGGFWNCDYDENGVIHRTGLPVAYAVSLNAIKRVKGFDASNCDWIVLDEFIPQLGERVLHTEGELLLDLYMTVSRDREKRGKDHLKLFLFANAEEISTPITNTLEIVDDIANLCASGRSHFYNEERKIMIHKITDTEVPLTAKEKTGMFSTMANTAWASKSFGGNFANNDFSNVIKNNLKGYRGFIHLHYKNSDYYIYEQNNKYYGSKIRTKCNLSYDLNKENDRKRFYIEYQIDLRLACIEDRFKFQTYSMYDLIVNYTKKFNVRN